VHGDEFVAVFPRASSAIEAAIDVQRRIAERAWPDGRRVRIRAGVHSGRPMLTDSGYVGLSVHAVARICFVGNGGQIIVSQATKTAVERSLPAGVRLRSLGRHRLAGLPKPEVLYQVVAKGLATRLPELRTALMPPAT
jgi:class 3 adenylate cyclase